MQSSRYIGLDFFLLDLFFLALIFVPIERLYPLWKEQKIFRAGFWTDLAYFFSSHVVVQVTTLLTMAPAAFFFRWAIDSPWQRAIGAQPGWLQFIEILVVADLAEYWIHRLFHVVPFLWRFHAIHHSSTTMDWLAGSRLHLFDVVITRAFVFAPMYALGFAPAPLTVYLVFVAFHAVFLHANVRFRFGRLAWLFGTPRFHHWHHSAEVIDKNFAIHLPVIDWLFGTLLPARRQLAEDLRHRRQSSAGTILEATGLSLEVSFPAMDELPAPPRVTAVLETCLHVENVERSARFYEGLFGFKRMAGDDRFCAFDVASGSVLLLFRRGGTLEPVKIPGGIIPPHDGSGRMHFAFAIRAEDLAAWLDRLQGRRRRHRKPRALGKRRRKRLLPRPRRTSGGTGYARHLAELLIYSVTSRAGINASCKRKFFRNGSLEFSKPLHGPK